MPLNNYILNGPSTPTGGRTVAQSWQWHLDNTEPDRGGVDLVAATGTPVLAPTGGTLTHVPNDGGAGNSCRFAHDDNPGWADVFSHLSSYVGVNGRHFNQGDVIAYSGNTGGTVDEPYAPHLHRHLLKNEVRYNPWDYFSTNTTPTPTPLTIEDEDMRIFKVVNAAGTTYYFAVGNGKWQAVSASYMSTARTAGFPEGPELTSTQWAKIRETLGSLGYSESTLPSF